MSMKSVIEATCKIYKDSSGLVDLDDPNAYNSIEFRRWGCLALDWICANHSTKGGLPRGQIIELFGAEGSGKTTAATVASVSVQKYKNRNQVGCCDLEGKYSVDYGYELGLQKDKYTLSRPRGKNRGEAAGETMINWVAEDDCGLILWDSFTATISKEESQGSLTDANIGKRAMLQSKIITKMLSNLEPDGPTVLVINQIRDNIGGYGAPTKSSGARALKFFAIIRIEVKASEKLKEGEGVIGQTVTFKNVKNQAGSPFLSETIDMYFNVGYDNTSWCIQKAIDLDVLQKKGSMYLYKGDSCKMAQLTEKFSNKRELIILYEECIKANVLIQTKQCEERKSKRTLQDSDAEF